MPKLQVSKKKSIEQEREINNSFDNSGGYGSFGTEGFFITEAASNPRRKFNSDVVNEFEFGTSKESLSKYSKDSKQSKRLKKKVTIDESVHKF